MGYNTEFFGGFKINKPLEPEIIEYFDRFNQTIHYHYDKNKLEKMVPDWRKYCFPRIDNANGSYYAVCYYEEGEDIEFFAPGRIDLGHPTASLIKRDDKLIKPNKFCQWKIRSNPNDKKDKKIYGEIVWDGSEKFKNYIPWLRYLVVKFFSPLNMSVNGAALAIGEDYEDARLIIIDNNNVISLEMFRDDGITLDLNTFEVAKNNFSDNKEILQGIIDIQKKFPSSQSIREKYWGSKHLF